MKSFINRVVPILALIVFAISCPLTVLSQDLRNWRSYRSTDGLRETQTVNIWPGSKGRIWTSHRNEDYFSVLDGYQTDSIPAAGAGNFAVHESLGGQIWAVYRNGVQIFDRERRRWTKFPISAIADEHATNLRRPLGPLSILSPRINQLLILLPEELLLFNLVDETTSAVLRHESANIGEFLDMVTASEGISWITAREGIARFSRVTATATSKELDIEFFPIPNQANLKDLRYPAVDSDGSVTMIATHIEDGSKTIIRFTNGEWHFFPELRDVFTQKNLRAPHKAWYQNGNYRAITTDTVIEFHEENPYGLDIVDAPSGYFFDAEPDNNGAFWIASSEGLLRYAQLPWQTPPGIGNDNALVAGICEQADGSIWIATADSLVQFSEEQWNRYDFPNLNERLFQPGDVIEPVGPSWLLLTIDSQNLVFDTTTREFLPPGEIPFDGLRSVGHTSQGTPIFLAQPGDQEPQLLLFDSGVLRVFATVPTDLVKSSVIEKSHLARNGDIWLTADNTAFRWSEGGWTTFTIGLGFSLDQTVDILERRAGDVLFAGEDRILSFDGRQFSTIRDHFDQINAIVESNDQSVWVATGQGIHRFKDETWIDNDEADGMPGPFVYAVFEDSRRRLWAGTNRGLALYRPDADVDGPRVTITSVPDLKERRQSVPISIEFTGIDYWSATAPERVLFSSQLDGGSWTPFKSSRSVQYETLPSGRHEVLVQAMDRNRNISLANASATFDVILPWTEDPRVKWALKIGSLGVLAFAGLAYNQHRKLRLSYLEVERIVAEKTRQLEVANRELLHTQKMKALGTMAAGVAHDFNSILSIIRGSAQLIGRNIQRPEKIRTRVDRILSVIDQGSSLVKAMLGFGFHGTDRNHPRIDVNDVAQDTLRLVEDRLGPKVEIQFFPADNTPRIHMSREVLQQILINLVFNAADAIAHEGIIEVRSGKRSELTGDIVLRPANADEYVIVLVKDHGCGISPENLSRIFEPFFTTKSFSERRGTGLGLSMVYEYAEDMRLGIAVQSIENEFTEIAVYIPVNVQTDVGKTPPMEGSDV